MTDKELLELAAKAAGIDARRLPEAWPERFDDDQWNPLTDDGDALRLAVELSKYNTFRLVISSGLIKQTTAYVAGNEGVDLMHEGDPNAATRRAIVRAVAEIGKVGADRLLAASVYLSGRVEG